MFSASRFEEKLISHLSSLIFNSNNTIEAFLNLNAL